MYINASPRVPPPAFRARAVPPIVLRRGVGAAGATPTTTQQLVGSLVGGANTGAGVAVSTGSKIAGGAAGALAMIAPFTGPAAPFLAAASAIVGPITKLFKGCGEPCEVATYYADTGQEAARMVFDRYFANAVRTRSMQAEAIRVLDAIGKWQQKGWTTDPRITVNAKVVRDSVAMAEESPMASCDPKSPNPGCTYWTAFCCAIAEDPGVVDDPAPTPSSVTAALSTPIAGVPVSELLIPAAVVLAGLFLVEAD